MVQEQPSFCIVKDSETNVAVMSDNFNNIQNTPINSVVQSSIKCFYAVYYTQLVSNHVLIKNYMLLTFGGG